MDSALAEMDHRSGQHAPASRADPVKPAKYSPSGSVIVRRLFEGPDATRIHVVRAEPFTRFSDALLTAIRDGMGIYPDARIDGVDHRGHTCDDATCSRDRTCFTGVRLHIDAANQHLIYLIGRYLPDDDAWEAVWPD